MNDTISLLLAATILAVGGVGLYMYKSDDVENGGENYNENTIFGSGNLWSSSNKEEEPIEEDEYDSYEPTIRNRSSKTKRNRKSVGTKRRYYK